MKHLNIVLGMTAFLLILGWVGNIDYKTQLFEQTVNTCEASQGETLLANGRECNQLINEVEADGKSEVMSADGRFWIESK